MLSLAAREADIIGILTTSTANGVLSSGPAPRIAAAVAQQIAWIKEAAGERFDAIELSVVPTIVIAAHRQQAAEEFIASRGWSGVTAEDVLAMPAIFIGSMGEIIAEMQARREQYGFSYYVISDSHMEAAAPIVARLAGT